MKETKLKGELHKGANVRCDGNRKCLLVCWHRTEPLGATLGGWLHYDLAQAFCMKFKIEPI